MDTKQPYTFNHVGRAQQPGYAPTHCTGGAQRLYPSNATTPDAGTRTNNSHPGSNAYIIPQYPGDQDQYMTAEERKALKSRIEKWRSNVQGTDNDAKGLYMNDDNVGPENLDPLEAERFKRCLKEKDRMSEFSHLRYRPQVFEENDAQTQPRAWGQHNAQHTRGNKEEYDGSETRISSDQYTYKSI